MKNPIQSSPTALGISRVEDYLAQGKTLPGMVFGDEKQPLDFDKLKQVSGMIKRGELVTPKSKLRAKSARKKNDIETWHL